MRFNELLSGVRADLDVKVMGDDLDQLLASANDILTVLQQIDGVADARVEQVTGLPVLSVISKRMALSRYGLNMSDVQDLVAMAVGGEFAGLIFHGELRFCADGAQYRYWC